MRIADLFLTVMAAGATVASGQRAPAPAVPAQPVFKLGLDPLYLPGYEPARELRLALWDSPMSRLELAAARQQWALRNPGPNGTVIPFQVMQLPLRLNLERPDDPVVLGPWNPGWDRLTWQEKVAAGAEDGVLLWGLIELLGHLR